MRKFQINLTKDKRRKDKSWMVRWWGEYDPKTGKQKRYSKSFSRKKTAERFMEEKKADFEAGMSIEHDNTTLAQMCDKFIKTQKNRLSYASLMGYQETILRLKEYFHPNTQLRNIKAKYAEDFISNLTIVNKDHLKKNKSLSDSARSKHLRQAKMIFNTAQRWGFLRTNPFDDISLGKIRTQPWHYITPEEFKALLQVVDKMKVRKNYKRQDEAKRIRVKAFYSVMYGCGLRFGEAANLLWDGTNIDFEQNLINLFDREGTEDIPSFEVKSYSTRSIPMPKHVADSLTELQSVSDECCPFVFLDSKGYERVKKTWHKLQEEGNTKKWTNRYLFCLLKTFQRQCRMASIKTTKKLTLHCLRKAYGTNLANLSTPIQTLKELMGHSKIETTMAYYLYSPDENKKKVVRQLDEMMVGKEKHCTIR
jgi:site-specific recombinase XerD